MPQFVQNPDGTYSGGMPAVIASVIACPIILAGTPLRVITCTNAATDYADSINIPAGTKYLRFYSTSEFRVAIGEATTAAVSGGASGKGWMFAAGLPETVAVLAADVAAGVAVHVRVATAGASVYYTPVA